MLAERNARVIFVSSCEALHVDGWETYIICSMAMKPAMEIQ